MIGLLSAVFNISVCVGFPITVFIVLLAKSKKLNTELKIFIVGICTYLAAQILFRQPLLAILQNIDSYRILISTNRVAYVAVLAVTAACAEEVGRYISFRFFVKNPEQQNTPLYFGLGHGGIEALSVGVNNVILLVCSPYTLINMGADVALAGVERISTLLAQVAFSYIVFCSYRKEKYRYLILAIILHTAYDLPIILLDYGVSPFIFEIGLFLFSAILFLSTLKRVRGYCLMKKIINLLACCLIVTSLLTACGNNKLPEWADTEALTEKARTMIDTLNAFDYDGVSEIYDNPEVDATTFEASGEIIKTYGEFESYGDVSYVADKTDDGSEFVRVIQVADYEKGKLTFTASFFEDGSVAGFKLAQ